MSARRVGRRHRDRRAKRLRIGAVVATLVVIGALAGYDAHLRRQAHQTQQRQRDTNVAAADVARSLLATHALAQDATSATAAIQDDIVTNNARLGQTQSQLNSTKETLWYQGINISTISECLDGVRRAYGGISGGRTDAAVRALTGAAKPCRDVQGGRRAGQVYPFDFPDPFVLPVGGEYYAYGTNAAAGNIQVIRSSNLTSWTTVGGAVPKLPAWADPGAVWAPSVLRRGSAFVLYYSTRVAKSDMQCISSAVAANPAGPFVDASTSPLMCQADQGGSIDPSTLVDSVGNVWLYWRSIGGAGHAATLWAQQLAPDGRSVVGDATPLLRADRAWEAGTVEAPTMAALGGSLYLFYSGNEWSSPHYGVGVARCSGPTGPCTKLGTGPILASQDGMAGPGGQSVFVSRAGQAWIAFHAWRPGEIGFPHSRVLYLRTLSVGPNGPTVGAAP